MATSNRRSKSVSLLVLAGFLTLIPFTEAKELVDYVNPFVGTGGHGHTFPGAMRPFGMVQASPDTRVLGWDSCGGYYYSDDFIYGFSHTHLSGTGISDYCDVLLMPQVDEVSIEAPRPDEGFSGYGSKFSHDQEVATPGYYAVKLLDSDIEVKLTTTERVALHSYSYPSGNAEKSVVIDIAHRDTVIESSFKRVSPTLFEGYRRSSAWAPDQKLFFVIQFEDPPVDVEFYESGSRVTADFANGKDVKAIVRLNKQTQTALVKVALSPVSVEGAHKNLESEMKTWDFEKVRNESHDVWNEKLSKVRVQSSDEMQKSIFYTALYHSYVSTNLFNDVDGSYRGRDDNIHTADHPYYTIFSLWDTFRSLHPLMTILEPEETDSFIETFLLMYQQGGLLPVWDLAGNETFCMNGYHSVSVIADAYAKGIQDFDTELALEAMQQSATQQHFGLDGYNEIGYVAREYSREGVSRTLEYAYDDWCIATFADALGEDAVRDEYYRRSQNYVHLFDPKSKFFRARENGGWFEPFDSYEINFNYTEGNAWHYRFGVPHDIPRLVEMYGGEKVFGEQLDALFNAPDDLSGRHQPDVAGLIGQYAHGNEPSHHVVYLYNYNGRASETQKRVREILNTMYSNEPDGLCGNEDCGQMSAWYVLSSLGIYSVAPGSSQWVIGSPLFDKATVELENGNAFTIIAENQSPENVFIQSIELNGETLNRSYLEHDEIVSGGELTVKMGAKPNVEWGAASESRPGQRVPDLGVIPAPLVDIERAFRDVTTLDFQALKDGGVIWYTLDGSEPIPGNATRYSGPVTIHDTTEVKAVFEYEGRLSSITTARSNRYDFNLKIEVHSPIHPQYMAGGTNALVNGVLGTGDFTTGLWQGYEGCDLEFVVELDSQKEITAISIGFLEDTESYILFPDSVEFAISSDKQHFTVIDDVDVIRTPVGVRQSSIQRVETKRSATGQYVRIRANYPGDATAWGSTEKIKSFLFCDEIQIDTK